MQTIAGFFYLICLIGIGCVIAAFVQGDFALGFWGAIVAWIAGAIGNSLMPTWQYDGTTVMDWFSKR